METFEEILKKTYIININGLVKLWIYKPIHLDAPTNILTLDELLNTFSYYNLISNGSDLKNRFYLYDFKSELSKIEIIKLMNSFLNNTSTYFIKDNKTKRQVFFLYMLYYLTKYEIRDIEKNRININELHKWASYYYIINNENRHYEMFELIKLVSNFMYAKELL